MDRQAQRESALARANEVKHARKELRQRVKDGELAMSDLIANPPAALDTAEVGAVLEWAPGIGRFRVQRLLASENGRPGRGYMPAILRSQRIGALSEQSRERIVERLRSLDGWGEAA